MYRHMQRSGVYSPHPLHGDPSSGGQTSPERYAGRGTKSFTTSDQKGESMSDIDVKYSQLGGTGGFLGAPVTSENIAPGGIGRYRHYQNGSIYWTPGTGAHEVHGAIRGKWSSLGWERSFLGYPLTDETTTPDGVGRYNHFQGGSVYWTPGTGAHEVHGAIRGKWSSLGWERSFLGYPTSDELITEDGTGRYSEFQHGSIYWSPATGALACRETVRLHVKCLTAPTRFTIDQMVSNMRLVYATAQVGVKYASFEVLTLPDLNDLDVGTCTMGNVTTEQTQLFANRNFAGPNDVVVYFVRSTQPPYNGCAAYPGGEPGAAVASGASGWTFGHEAGHVLGLSH